MIYLPFRPIRGQAFTLYGSEAADSNAQPQESIDNISVSKDGGTFVTASNAHTQIASNASDGGSGNRTRGCFTLVLTSTEMDADVVIVRVFDDANAQHILSYVIYTCLNELAAAPTLNSSQADKITAIFEYLFFKRTVTATVETLFKSDASTSLATNTLSDNGTTVSKGALA